MKQPLKTPTGLAAVSTDVGLIRELAEILSSHRLSEIEVWTGGVRICRSSDVPAMQAIAGTLLSPTLVPPSPEAGVTYVNSPLVGTFYRASSPEAAPYVEEGTHVHKGQVLAIIEAMKLMNEIEAEADGTILDIMVNNGQPVEYGEPLFKVKVGPR